MSNKRRKLYKREERLHIEGKQDFVNFVDKQLGLSGKYEIMKKDYGHTGTFIFAELNGEKIFIKGDDLSINRNFYNEIEAQRRLLTLNEEEKSLFVCMKSFYDGKEKFIVYPRFFGITLVERHNQDYLWDYRPVGTELQELGKFLLDVLGYIIRKKNRTQRHSA